MSYGRSSAAIDGIVDYATDGDQTFDVVWLRRSLGICGYLERMHLLSCSDRAVLSLAIMAAPRGGSGADELLVTFGGTRDELLARVEAALRPTEAEPPQDRQLKTMLCAELLKAWSA
ncbi:hypothetical protein ACFYVR_26390 [Rhodococcus sp. NPDC003318]|uniref:hypothetical protein n=1 Tax=Rhodococcus sp. NPDC003318 TaxID=3364503 RepID=UPI0036CA3335